MGICSSNQSIYKLSGLSNNNSSTTNSSYLNTKNLVRESFEAKIKIKIKAYYINTLLLKYTKALFYDKPHYSSELLCNLIAKLEKEISTYNLLSNCKMYVKGLGEIRQSKYNYLKIKDIVPKDFVIQDLELADKKEEYNDFDLQAEIYICANKLNISDKDSNTQSFEYLGYPSIDNEDINIFKYNVIKETYCYFKPTSLNNGNISNKNPRKNNNNEQTSILRINSTTSFCNYKDTLYLSGGDCFNSIEENSKNLCLNSIFRIDLLTNETKCLNSLILNRYHHSMIAFEKFIFIIGGNVEYVEIYNIEDNTSFIHSKIIVKRIKPALMIVNNKWIYAFGGIDFNTRTDNYNFEKMNLKDYIYTNVDFILNDLQKDDNVINKSNDTVISHLYLDNIKKSCSSWELCEYKDSEFFLNSSFCIANPYRALPIKSIKDYELLFLGGINNSENNENEKSLYLFNIYQDYIKKANTYVKDEIVYTDDSLNKAYDFNYSEKAFLNNSIDNLSYLLSYNKDTGNFIIFKFEISTGMVKEKFIV